MTPRKWAYKNLFITDETLINLEVATVGSFQGREKDFIIISRVKLKRFGFLDKDFHFNVAMTRAKHGLIVVGRLKKFIQASNKNCKALLTYLYYHNCILSKDRLFSEERNQFALTRYKKETNFTRRSAQCSEQI